MRHLRAGRKLNRSSSHRLALLRNLVTSLLRHEKIRTTDAKAKELRRWADRMIGLGKEGSLHARRRALAIVRDRAVVRKVFDTLAPRFKDRLGGYTRTVKIGWRRGDRAPITLVELLPAEAAGKSESAPQAKRRSRRPAAQRERAPKKSPPSQRSTGQTTA